jgi:hypothetical protein
MTDKEFTEISPAGGTLEFIIDKDKNSIAFGFRGGPKSRFRAMHALRVSLQGRILGYLPMGGICRRERPPDMEFPVTLNSDMKGMFGRRCPKCKSYFRMSAVSDSLYCPYCGIQDGLTEFLTDNQRLYVNKIIEMAREAIEKRETLELDLDAVIDELPNNRPSWLYVEEKQQNIYECKHCQCSFDVLGEYGTCPNCGEINAQELFISKMDALWAELVERLAAKQIAEGDIPGSALAQMISTFEAMANFLKKRLALIPMTPRRRKEFERLSFQRFVESSDSLRNWFGIDMLKALGDADVRFVNIQFHRRHLVIHNNSQVDKKYLTDTADNTVRLNQKIRIAIADISRLDALLRQSATNLITDFLAMQ